MTLSIECPGVQRGRRMVLAPQDFVFSDGVTTLVGLNGAGKTTLFEFVLGLLETTSASSCLIEHAGGRAISSGSRNEFMGAIGYQPQHIPAPRGMRLDGFVEHAAWLKGLSAHAAKLACSRALAQVGLNDRSRSKLSDLSGGTRRRAGLAAAIVHQPSVLLLDEPTAGLDPVERARFHELIRELAPQRTIIVSTHLIDDVVGLGGNIVGLMDGKLTVRGSVASHEDGGDVGEQLLAWFTGGAR